jgi:hypothetical protein
MTNVLYIPTRGAQIQLLADNPKLTSLLESSEVKGNDGYSVQIRSFFPATEAL